MVKRRWSEKERIPRKELVKLTAEKSGYHQYECEDVINAFYDVLFESIMQNKEVFLPNLGKLYMQDPKPHRYWDERQGKYIDTVTYPILKFRISAAFRDKLRSPFFNELKREMREQYLKALEEQADEEFEIVFASNKPLPKPKKVPNASKPKPE